MSDIVSALAEMSKQVWALHDRLGEGVLLVNRYGERFLWVNAAICRALGYSEEEMLSLGVRHLHPPETLPCVVKAFEQIEERRLDSAREVPFLRKDGELIYGNVTMTLVELGGSPCVLALFHDVTQERKAATALRESEVTLRSLFDNLPDVVVVVDDKLNIRRANRDGAEIDQSAIVGRCALDFVAMEDRTTAQEGFDRAMAAGSPQTATVRGISGQCWACRVVRLGEENNAKRAMIICTNVTPERAAAEAVKKEQQLLRRMLELQEQERRMIASEIHDGFAQQLTGALFRLQAFRETLSRNSERAWKDFDDAARTLARAIDETRRLISGVRPLILDELGIVDAIEYLVCERRLQGGPEIDFEHEVTASRFSPPLENAIFRIVLEALGNACRHSQSNRIYISLRQHGGRIHLVVRDWGVGFHAAPVGQEERFGLQVIRERVRLLDGTVTIESAPDQGTQISVDLPQAVADGDASDRSPPTESGE